MNCEISTISKRLPVSQRMNSSLPFCPDPFWDADLTWNTERPSLTACFRQTALVYLPLAAAALLAPLEMGSLLKRPSR